VVEFINKPSTDKALVFVAEWYTSQSDRLNLVIVGSCQVRYHGRARSFLDWGDRVVLVKQDDTVIVHRPMGREPVNWQPNGGRITFHTEHDLFTLRAMHYKNKERMEILFRHVAVMIAGMLSDKATLQIVGMEKDIVDKILEDPEVIEQGLRITQHEKQTSSGIIDLYGYDCHHIPVVIEVKRGQGTISAVQQLRMYVKDLKKGNPEAVIRGILCAPKIPDMIRNLLEDYQLEYREFGWQHELHDDRQKNLQDF